MYVGIYYAVPTYIIINGVEILTVRYTHDIRRLKEMSVLLLALTYYTGRLVWRLGIIQ